MSKTVWILLFGIFYSISITRAKTAKPPPTWLKPKPTPIPSLSKYKAPMISKPKTSQKQPILNLKKPKTNENKDIFIKTSNVAKENFQEQTTPVIKSKDKKSIGSEKEIVVELEATEFISDNVSNADAVQIIDDTAMKEKNNISKAKNEKILSKIETALLKSVTFNKDKLWNQNITEDSEAQVPSMIPIFRSTLVNRKKSEDLKENFQSSKKYQKFTPTENPKNKDKSKICDERQKFNQSLIFQLFENLNLKHGSAVVPIHNYKTENEEILKPQSRTNDDNSKIESQNSNNQRIEDCTNKTVLNKSNTVELDMLHFNTIPQTLSQNLQSQKVEKAKLTEDNYENYASLAGTNDMKPMMLSFIPMTQFQSHYFHSQKEEDANSFKNNFENSAPLVKTNETRPVIINFIPMNHISSQSQQPHKEKEENPLCRQENYQNSAPSARSNDIKPVMLNFIPINQTPNRNTQYQKDKEDEKLNCRPDHFELSTSLSNSDNAKLVNLHSLVQVLNQNQKCIDERPLSKLELGENSTPLGRSDVKPITLHSFITQYPKEQYVRPLYEEKSTDIPTLEKRPIILNFNSVAQNPGQNIQYQKTLEDKSLHYRQNNFENSGSLVNSEGMKQELFNLNSAQMQNQNLRYQKVVDVTPIFKNILSSQECGKNAVLAENTNAANTAILKNTVFQNPSQSIQNKNLADVKPMYRQAISAPLAQMNTANPAILNLNPKAQNSSHNIQCQKISDSSIVSTDYKSGNKANLVLYKPETVSLLNAYGDFLKELTMTVLVPFYVSSLQK